MSTLSCYLASRLVRLGKFKIDNSFSNQRSALMIGSLQHNLDEFSLKMEQIKREAASIPTVSSIDEEKVSERELEDVVAAVRPQLHDSGVVSPKDEASLEEVKDYSEVGSRAGTQKASLANSVTGEPHPRSPSAVVEPHSFATFGAPSKAPERNNFTSKRHSEFTF